MKKAKLSKKQNEAVSNLMDQANAHRISIKRLSISANQCEKSAWELIRKFKPQFDSRTMILHYDHITGEVIQEEKEA